MFRKETWLVFVYDFVLLNMIVDMFYTIISVIFPTQLISDIILSLDDKNNYYIS
jgi:hypothetical protein